MTTSQIIMLARLINLILKLLGEDKADEAEKMSVQREIDDILGDAE